MLHYLQQMNSSQRYEFYVTVKQLVHANIQQGSIYQLVTNQIQNNGFSFQGIAP